ncbi:MAG: hypothetical protein ACF8TS_21110, partial [Maioricimonas sp. JB049]
AAFGDVRPDEIGKEIERERPQAKPASVPPPSAPAPPSANSKPDSASPPSRRAVRRRSKSPPRNGSADGAREKEGSSPPAGAELEFWEQRVADLLDEEGPAT